MLYRWGHPKADDLITIRSSLKMESHLRPRLEVRALRPSCQRPSCRTKTKVASVKATPDKSAAHKAVQDALEESHHHSKHSAKQRKGKYQNPSLWHFP